MCARACVRLAAFDAMWCTRGHLFRVQENEYAGVPCGIMDQYIISTATVGHAKLIDCRCGGGGW